MDQQQHEEQPPTSPASSSSSYTLFLKIMSKRKTWVFLFVLVYAILLDSSWNFLKSILSWYHQNQAQYQSPGWPALYASVLLGGVFGLISMAAAVAVAVPATMVTWITVVVLLAFFGKPKRTLVAEGKKITREIAGSVLKTLLTEGNVVAVVCAVLGYYVLVLLCDEMDIKEIENPTMVSVGSEKTSMDSKGKNIICYDKKWEDQLEDASGSDHGDTVSLAGSEDNYEFDLSYNYDDGDYDDYTDDVSDDCDNHEFLYEDDYWIMQSHFDNVDLSPGVEASLNLLKDSSLIEDMQQQLKAVAASFNLLGIKNEAILDVNDGLKSASTSTVMVPRESGFEQKKGNEEHIMQNFRSFKHFDVVDVFSSHRYCNLTSSGQTYPKEYAKRIQEEWKILESGLPETIYVRVCEANMGLLRAVIMGPSGTPYHDGLFFFDCFFPPKYPNEPPMVYFYSGGLRLNPNLYSCGKVCLSLLGTWHGEETEMWVPGQSTMLQVLVSIQALILNAKPFFNEPGFEMSYVGAEGEKRSRKYNEDAFALSLKTMIYTLRRPPQHFEDFVAGHFRTRARDIIMACEAYKEGAAIGSVLVKDCVPDPIKTENSSSERFKRTMTKMIDAMVKVFVENGSTYEQFLNSST